MPAYTLDQNAATTPLLFLLLDSSDHLTGKTGLAPTVTLSKSGGAFAAPAGAVSELGSGWYKVAGNATDTNTLGPLILHATAAGADPSDEVYQVVMPVLTGFQTWQVVAGYTWQDLQKDTAAALGGNVTNDGGTYAMPVTGTTRLTVSADAAGNRTVVRS